MAFKKHTLQIKVMASHMWWNTGLNKLDKGNLCSNFKILETILDKNS